MRKLDQIFGALLILGSCGHTAGTIMWLPAMSGIWIWSLGSALAGLLLGALNLVRAARPYDKPVALIAVIGTALWALIAFAFGKSIGNIFDPRPLIHVIVSVVLVIFGIRTLRYANSNKALNN